MKKIIKNISLLSLMIMTLILFTDRVYAVAYGLTDICQNRLTEDVCTKQPVDKDGNSCKWGYNGSKIGCYVNNEAKQCAGFAYTVCPEEDDYGNKCAPKSQICTPTEYYVYHEPKSCADYSSGECPNGGYDEYGNLCGKDTGGECYISDNNQLCASITDYGSCIGRQGECGWYDGGDVEPSYCYEIIKPTATSTPCGDIKDLKECRQRATDCKVSVGVAGEYCTDKDGSSNSKSGKKGGSGSYITTDDTPFKCSDVKYLTGAWTLIRIAAPFIVILFGSLDFIKAVMASDEKKMKETKGKFIKRVIAFVLLILLPFVVQFIFSNMGTYGSDNMCLVKCIVTNNTAEEECD